MEINRNVFVLLMTMVIAVPVGVIGLLLADAGRPSVVPVQNTAKENFPINDHDFELRDDGGVKYVASSELGAMTFLEQKKLASLGGQFPPGVPVNSAVLFATAPGATGLKLWLVQEKSAIDLGQ